MTINLEEESAARFPSVKLDKEGDQWLGMLIDYDPTSPLYDYATGQRAVTDDGKEKTKDVLTVLLLPKTKCIVNGEPAQEGSFVRVHIQGHNRYTQGRSDSFREAKRVHGGLQVGDVIRGRITEITNIGSNGRPLNQPKKVIGFDMRRAKPEEAALVQRCVEEHQRLKAVPLEPATGGGPSFEEEPF
jgi:hypothetical protein